MTEQETPAEHAFDDDRERLNAYAHIRVFESDFDRSQAQIRTAASVWIVSALGGIFFVYSDKAPVPTVFQPEELSAFICFLASFGLSLLWMIDQRVYQRLLHSAFTYGLATEAANPDLPQIRTTMFMHNANLGPVISWYYRAPIYLFASLNLLFCGYDVAHSESSEPGAHSFRLFIVLVGLGVNLILVIWFQRWADRWTPLTEAMADFGAPVQTYFQQREYVTRLRAHQLPKKAK